MPCYKIYEDDFVLAFLDISNDLYGHTLVIPKRHYENIVTCDKSTLVKMIEACKKVGDYYVKNCGFDFYNILNVGEDISHFHFHIFPRKNGDKEKVYPKLSGCDTDLEVVCKKLALPQEGKVSSFDDSQSVVLYTDGACSGNPGAGGYAAILSYKGKEKVITGGQEMTTNNRMELMAVIVGLESVKENVPVKVYSDSAYVVNAFNQNWIDSWQKNNWKTSGKSEVLNKDLWIKLLSETKRLNVEFVKVKGHSDNEYNNRCDELAREEIAKLNN